MRRRWPVLVLILFVAMNLVGCGGILLTEEEKAKVKKFGADIAALELELQAIIAQSKVLMESESPDPIMIAELAGKAATVAAKIAGIKGQIEEIIAAAEKRTGTWGKILSVLETMLIAGMTYLGVRQGRLKLFGSTVSVTPPTTPT